MGILDGKVAIVTGASRGIGRGDRPPVRRRRRRGGRGRPTTDTGTSPFPGTIAETVEQIRAARRHRGGRSAPTCPSQRTGSG